MNGSKHPVLLPWYAAGSLSAAQAQEIAAHLEDCVECRDELCELQSLQATMKSEAALDLDREGSSRAFGKRAWRLAAAMLFFGTLLGMVGTRWAVRMDSGIEPVMDSVLQSVERIVLTPATRSSKGIGTLSGDGPWALTVLMPVTAPADTYDVRLEQSDGLSIVDVGPTAVSDADNTVCVLLKTLPAGDYVLLLRARGVVDRKTYRYALRITGLQK